MNIHQLSVTYQPEQDRILVRVSTTASQEVQLWLTRRLMRGFWPIFTRSLEEVMLHGEPTAADRPELRPAMAQMRREQLMHQADFATPYQETKARPLGDQPLLVTEVKATPLPAGRLRLGFSEQLPGQAQGRSFDMVAEASLLQGLSHLLNHALTSSGWQAALAAAASPEQKPAVEDDTPSERPRYLN